MLAHHKLGSRFSQSSDFVFCTRTGRPFGQRNVTRALREAQRKATDGRGHLKWPQCGRWESQPTSQQMTPSS